MAERLQLRFSFLCGLRGYHEYRLIWTPTLHEVLKAKQEPSNCHDMYAIACKKKLPSRLTVSTVGHLPKEVSRLTFYITLHGTRAILREIIDDSGDSGDSDLELEL